MPWPRQTLSQLIEQAQADLQSAFGTNSLLRHSVLRIIAKIQAAFSKLQGDYIDYVAKQAVPWTATDEYLAGWGALKDVTQKPAGYASGPVTFAGTTGTLLSAGTPLSLADGTELVATETATATAGLVTVMAQMVEPGAAGNVTAGARVMLGTSIPGLQASGTCGDFSGGADGEDLEAFRSRVLYRYRNPPQGGSQADYIGWALEVPGVTRAWCQGMGGGQLVVYVMLDDANSAGEGFPSGTDGLSQLETRSGRRATGDQLAVADHIFPFRPVTAMVFVAGPIRTPVNFQVTGLGSAPSSIRAQVSASIRDTFRAKGEPGGTVNLSDLESAIAAIPGTSGFVVTTPSTNIRMPSGGLPVLGTITYI